MDQNNVKKLSDEELNDVAGGGKNEWYGNIHWHMIMPGETLSSIARAYKTNVETIMWLNAGQLKDPNKIRAYQQIMVPLK